MEDKLLIDGLFARDERSVARLEEKYSGYCYTVAYAVVRCREDAQECVSDAMLGAWNSIPPNRPENLGAYVGRIARNSALNLLKVRRAKRMSPSLSMSCRSVFRVPRIPSSRRTPFCCARQ